MVVSRVSLGVHVFATMRFAPDFVSIFCISEIVGFFRLIYTL